MQDVDKYIAEGERQLNNPVHYAQVTEDPTKNIAKKSNKIVDALKTNHHIDENTHKWAKTNPDSVRSPTFYHLPKVHKDPVNPPGRPIVSGVNGPTEKLSKLVDHWLVDIVKSLPSYVKDTTHMLKTIEEWNHDGPFPDAHLVTLDVVGLYTNIPHKEIEEAIASYLETGQMNGKIPPLSTIMEIVNFVLSNNFFSFEGKSYHQIYGTAMGTPMAPTVANLFMGWLEKKLLDNSPVTIEMKHWKRFIDDICILWLNPISELSRFETYINQIHPTIKFTVNSSPISLPFLDILIKLEHGIITTDLYTKATDAHSYLQYDSCHPSHCKNSIPFSQFMRLRRICSSDTKFDTQAKQMAKHFKHRGYPKKIIREAQTKARSIDRKDALIYKPKQQQNRVPFIVTHNPLNPPLRTWHNTHFDLLKANQRLKKAIPDLPILGERKCKSLRHLLMPSQLPRVNSVGPPGCQTCDKQRCIICRDHLVSGRTFTSDRTGESFNIRECMTCTTSGIIYLLYCAKCKCAQYTGETQNSLKTRFYLHRSEINRNKGTHVTEHFNQADHSVDDLRCIIIEKVYSNTLTRRLRRENFWMNKLQTVYPLGLNSVNHS